MYGARMFVGILGLCMLAACASGPQERGTLDVVSDYVQSKLNRQTAIPTKITADQFADAPGPVIVVTIGEDGAQGTIVRVGQNADVDTYQSADGISLALRRGILISSRGFGHDLMAADVGGLLQALAGGAAQYTRQMTYLDGEDRLEDHVLSCVLHAKGPQKISIYGKVSNTRYFVEHCTTQTAEIENQYWVSGGRIIKSSQWVGPHIAQLLFEVVKE